MEKQISVLKRAEIKKASNDYNVIPGDLVCIVKGSTGNVYVTTLRRNKQHTCTCPARKECYHIKALRVLENARYDAEKAYHMSDAVYAKLASIAEAEKAEEISEGIASTVKSADLPKEECHATPVSEKLAPKLTKRGNKLVKRMDGQSARTLDFFSNLPSRQKKPAA